LALFIHTQKRCTYKLDPRMILSIFLELISALWFSGSALRKIYDVIQAFLI